MTEDSNKTDNKGRFERTIKVHAGTQIDPKTQESLNAPLADEASKLSSDDKAFLANLVQKVEAGEIKLMEPSSIIKQNIYETLKPEHQARVEQFVSGALFTLRQIYDFYHSKHPNDSYQMAHLLSEIRMKKEVLEKEFGDVLKI